LYRSAYSDGALEGWAHRIRKWRSGREPQDARKIVNAAPPTSKGRDVYCFFDNTDAKLCAPFDAQTLTEKLGLVASRGPGDAAAAQHA
jgi:uncharacterized protein YecE (DUF72 family)